MPVAKEQIRQIIADNNLSSVADVYALLKDSFKDILQELMEAELDVSLGYEKNQKGVLDMLLRLNPIEAQKEITMDVVEEYNEFCKMIC